MSCKVSIQVSIEDIRAIRVYKSLRHGMKRKALERALLLLLENEIYREIFFDEKILEDSHPEKKSEPWICKEEEKVKKTEKNIKDSSKQKVKEHW